MREVREYMKEKSIPLLDKKDIFMYFAIPKNASRSISRIVLADRIIHWKGETADKYCEKFDAYSDQQIKQMFKFTIARNPFERVVSAFFYIRHQGRIEPDIEFKDFVKDILAKEGTVFDSHFWEQTRFICHNGKLLVDYVARLDNIVGDWKKIASEIGCQDYLPRSNRVKRMKFTKYYDRESFGVIKDIYSDDIKLLGYGFPERIFD